MTDWVPNNRERTKDAERSKMAKSGKNTGTLYRNALLKRANHKKMLAQRKAQKALTSDTD